MSEPTIEQRIAVLEREVVRLNAEVLAAQNRVSRPWWELRFGVFQNDEMHEEAMRLGAEYRRSLVPATEEAASPDEDVSA